MHKKLLFSLFLILGMASIANAQCTTGNCFDGNGSYLFENGDLYNGQWKKGEMTGYGVYEFSNGDVYKGAWKEGKMNGRGHFHWDLPGDLMTNAKYEGFFKDGVPKNIEIPVTGDPSAQPER